MYKHFETSFFVRILLPLLAAVISFAVIACNKHDSPVDPPQGGGVVIPKPVGTTLGEP